VAITTIAAYKTWAGISGTDQDSLLSDHLAKAEAKLARYLGMQIEQDASYTERQDGTGENRIQFDVAVINSVSALEILDDDGTVAETIAAADYYIDPRAPGTIALHPAGGARQHVTDLHGPGQSNEWRPLNVFPRGHGNIKLSGDVGFATIPDDLEEAVFILMGASIARRGRDTSLGSIAMGTVNASFRSPEEATRAAYEAARPWRREL
jgi:hypothetical protein